MKPGYEYGAKYKDVLTKDVLYQLYVVEGKTQKAIAEQLGVSTSMVAEFRYKYDIPTRDRCYQYNNRGGNKRPRNEDDYFVSKLAGIRKYCDNPKCPQYKSYGGRGIDYNREWKHWRQFKHDVVSRIGPRPSPKHSLDRKDNNKGYFADNLRWATHTIQANNTRSNRYLTLFGETKTITQWTRDSRVKCTSWSRIDSRLRNGWSVEKALLEPVPEVHDSSPTLVLFDETKTLNEWVNDNRVKCKSKETIMMRLKHGWSTDEALLTPVRNYSYKCS